MRGVRAPVLLFVCTAAVIVVALLIIIPEWKDFGRYAYMQQSMSKVGKHLAGSLLLLLGCLCALIAPALTSGAITMEREQQTLDMLLLSRLSNANIVFGKLTSALSLLVIILLCVLPVLSISFLIGGVSPAQVLWSVATIFTCGVLFSSIGLYCSARFRKTTTAVSVAYGVCLFWLGTIFLWVLVMESGSSDDFGPLAILGIIGLSLFTAIFPTQIMSLLYSAITRRVKSTLEELVIWCVFTIAVLAPALVFHKAIYDFGYDKPEIILLGNPGIALMTLCLEDFADFSVAWAEKYFVAITVGITLLAVLLVLILTMQRVRALRESARV